ncbi:MAG: glycosyltransferase family 1 protein [Gammaproteobacteria bacterium]|nr:MAG: glycosyltransferase family 1 protein [Gammaproteobacteria bacterium]
MKLAFCLYKVFPYGGLARDFVRIAECCKARGHEINVFTMVWHGPVPDGFHVTILPSKGFSNHARNRVFHERLSGILHEVKFDRVIGFNKMPNLDIYYAADPCYLDKVATNNSWLYRLGGRYRHYAACERAVFGKEAATLSLLISDVQLSLFKEYYQTPDARLKLLPPGISKDRIAPLNSAEIRKTFREEFRVGDDEKVVLMIGTAYRTKGLDRALRGLAALPDPLRAKTRLFVVGEDKTAPFEKMASQLGVREQLFFLGGRDDVPRFLLGADMLLQPSYKENTGTAILEAIVSGLPVLATAVCGYAQHVEKAEAGRVVPEPFDDAKFAGLLEELLTSPGREQWRKNGLAYAQTEDLYSMPEKAADLILGDSID